MKTRSRTLRAVMLAALAFSIAGTDPSWAQQPKRPTPQPPREPRHVDTTPGLSGNTSGSVFPGERAPDFVLDGSAGRPVKLSSLRGDWVVLIFADRMRDITPINSIQNETRLLGGRVVAVVHEKAHHVASAVKRDSLDILVLSDPIGEVADMYGLYDSGRSKTQPGFLVINRRGIVRLTVLGQTLPPEDILRLTRFAVTGA